MYRNTIDISALISYPTTLLKKVLKSRFKVQSPTSSAEVSQSGREGNDPLCLVETAALSCSRKGTEMMERAVLCELWLRLWVLRTQHHTEMLVEHKPPKWWCQHLFTNELFKKQLEKLKLWWLLESWDGYLEAGTLRWILRDWDKFVIYHTNRLGENISLHEMPPQTVVTETRSGCSSGMEDDWNRNPCLVNVN